MDNDITLNSSDEGLKFLCIGDPHFKTKNKKETDIMTKRTIEIARKLNPDFIVILGDVLDTHERIHVVPLTQAINWIEKISKIAHTYVLIGNHDRPNNSDFLSDYHPFNGLKTNSNVTIVDNVVEEEINGRKFIFVPYVPPGRFIDALSTKIDIDKINEYDVIFAHQEFYGAKMGAITSESGDKWPLIYPYVISGHIHDYNKPQENILYVGTPLQHAFGDSTSKTISLYTLCHKNNLTLDEALTNTNNLILDCTVTKINELTKDMTEYRIDLDLPKKRIYRLNTTEILTWVPPNNSLVKVVIRGTSAEIKACSKLDLIKMHEKNGIKIDYKIHKDEYEAVRQNITVNRNQDHTEKFKDLLYKKIYSDDGLLMWYREMFGQMV